MKNKLFTLGLTMIIGSTAFAQNQPDSIHIVLRENQNGTMRVLDTIVPVSQQQSLFAWMETQGWDAPPPPPSHRSAPVRCERVIILDDDSGSAPSGERHMMIMKMEGDSGVVPPRPPQPPCRVVRVKTADGVVRTENVEGPEEAAKVIIVRGPVPPVPPLPALPPLPPGSKEVTVTHKDTVINGETRKMIVRTERIILPPSPPSAPAPAADKKSAPQETQRGLVVYPNPSTDVINVEFDVDAKSKTTLRVVDMNGKVVYSEVIVEDQSKHVKREINLSGKGKGAYTVEVESAGKVIAERVILQ